MPTVIVRKKRSGSQRRPLFVVIRREAIRSAVRRNLVRRRIRAIMRPILDKAGHPDYCVIVKKGADMLSFEDLTKDVFEAMRHA